MTLWVSNASRFGTFQKIIDYLKIDVEGAEFAAFKAMLESGILKSVKQIGFEIHYKYGPHRTRYQRTWKLLTQLEEAGFKQWIMEHNNDKTMELRLHPELKGQFCCSNLYMININYFKQWERQVHCKNISQRDVVYCQIMNVCRPHVVFEIVLVATYCDDVCLLECLFLILKYKKIPV